MFKLLVTIIPLGLFLATIDAAQAYQVEGALEHYSRIVELAPEVSAEASLSVPYVQIYGQKVFFNGPFWELVQGWVRLYFRELDEECDHCMDLNEEAFTQAAVDVAARSFMHVKIQEPILDGIGHIGVGTAQLGAQLGKTAAIAKITAEVAETGVSKLIGGGGVHLFCHVLDAIILFGTRKLQTLGRIWSWSEMYDRNSAAQIIRLGFVSSVIKRAQKRVRFVVGPVVVDEAEMKEVDLEGPNRWWGWAKEGKRARWLRKLASKKQGVKLAQADFLGARQWRYLLLKGRTRGHSNYLKGSTAMDRALENRNGLWVMAVQENMIQRAFVSNISNISNVSGGEEADGVLNLAESDTPKTDEVRHELAREFSGTENQAQFVEQLLRDVDVIFNARLARSIRYFHVAKIEALLAGFMYGRFSAALEEVGESHGSTLTGIYRRIKLNWRAGRFGSYIYDWADFVRLAALESDSTKIQRYRYEAMESLLRILRIFQVSGALREASTVEGLNRFEDLMAKQYQSLKSFTPWKPKRIEYSWMPWRNPKPLCAKMEEL